LAVIEHHHRRTWVRGAILQGSWLLIAGGIATHFYGWSGLLILGGGILVVLVVLLLVGGVALSL
jgi:hypothetical protein